MNNTDIAAWWGAIVATLVLSWDVVKWATAGPKLRVVTRPNVSYPDARVVRREGIGAARVEHLADYCHIEVRNVGGAPTTVISIEGTHDIGKHAGQVFVSGARFQSFNGSLPTLLGPGEVWSARVEMGDLESLAKRGRPVLRIRASHLRKDLNVYPEVTPKSAMSNR